MAFLLVGQLLDARMIVPERGAGGHTINRTGGITATPQRDGAGRITGYSWSDGSANAVTQTWTRGAGGRIEKAESNVPGAPAFDYLIDPLQPEASFDPYGRRLKAQTAGGEWTYTYGSGGQLSSAVHPTLGSFSYAFDGIGRRTDQGTANTTDLLNRTTAWSHDQNKTLTIQAHPDARVWFNGTEVTDFSGSHQVALTAPGTEGGWVPWETLAILEGAGDGAGDPPVSPLASPDAKAEKKGAVWVPPAAETLTYDAAGNRQSSAQWDYGWNAKNQLARIRTKDYATAPQAYDISFSYDAEGRRVKKHVVEYADGSPVAEKTVTFVWDDWELLYERHQLPSGLTTLERKYLWGPDIADGRAGGAGGLLLMREKRGDTTTEIIPLYDGTGHVVALTDIEKNLLAEYAYGPFGEKIAASGSRANSNPWRYATKYLDQETGLYYFGHRYYDPITGQWLSREPLGESESINLYLYAGNDPINHVDVQGLATVALSGQSPTEDFLSFFGSGDTGYDFSGPDRSPVPKVKILETPNALSAMFLGYQWGAEGLANWLAGRSNLHATVAQTGSNFTAILASATRFSFWDAQLNADYLRYQNVKAGTGIYTATADLVFKNTAYPLFFSGQDPYTLQEFSGLDRAARFSGGLSATTGAFLIPGTAYSAPLLSRVSVPFDRFAPLANRFERFSYENPIMLSPAYVVSPNRATITQQQFALPPFRQAEGGVVIGRGADLNRPFALAANEFRLSWPATATTRSEWKINSGLLRIEMRKGIPIRDASPGNVGGMYLNAERNLLQSHGWNYNSSTGYWNPPGN